MRRIARIISDKAKSKEFVMLGLPEDSITVWEGSTRGEPRIFTSAIVKEYQGRLTCRIPTWSYSVSGHDYINRHLVGLMQDGATDLGCAITREFDDSDSLVPIIARCGLEDGDCYVLVHLKKQSIVGRVSCWDRAGTKDRLYLDVFVVAFAIQNDLVLPLKEAIRKRCQNAHVPFRDLGVSPRTIDNL